MNTNQFALFISCKVPNPFREQDSLTAPVQSVNGTHAVWRLPASNDSITHRVGSSLQTMFNYKSYLDLSLYVLRSIDICI